mmetsp:Transcript_35579/g.111844  ORF Transcript_35579/g.111844 Transcript_35579/m.111844 type:complete len:330 (-) Transcript_35579:19-1008(-)
MQRLPVGVLDDVYRAPVCDGLAHPSHHSAQHIPGALLEASFRTVAGHEDHAQDRDRRRLEVLPCLIHALAAIPTCLQVPRQEVPLAPSALLRRLAQHHEVGEVGDAAGDVHEAPVEHGDRGGPPRSGEAHVLGPVVSVIQAQGSLGQPLETLAQAALGHLLHGGLRAGGQHLNQGLGGTQDACEVALDVRCVPDIEHRGREPVKFMLVDDCVRKGLVHPAEGLDRCQCLLVSASQFRINWYPIWVVEPLQYQDEALSLFALLAPVGAQASRHPHDPAEHAGPRHAWLPAAGGYLHVEAVLPPAGVHVAPLGPTLGDVGELSSAVRRLDV